MVDQAVVEAVRKYLRCLPDQGIHPEFGVLYGSFALERQHEWSDIDLVVVAPEFDGKPDRELRSRLWISTKHADHRIEPIACGARQWQENDSNQIIEIARREGVIITVDSTEPVPANR